MLVRKTIGAPNLARTSRIWLHDQQDKRCSNTSHVATKSKQAEQSKRSKRFRKTSSQPGTETPANSRVGFRPWYRWPGIAGPSKHLHDYDVAPVMRMLLRRGHDAAAETKPRHDLCG